MTIAILLSILQQLDQLLGWEVTATAYVDIDATVLDGFLELIQNSDSEIANNLRLQIAIVKEIQ